VGRLGRQPVQGVGNASGSISLAGTLVPGSLPVHPALDLWARQCCGRLGARHRHNLGSRHQTPAQPQHQAPARPCGQRSLFVLAFVFVVARPFVTDRREILPVQASATMIRAGALLESEPSRLPRDTFLKVRPSQLFVSFHFFVNRLFTASSSGGHVFSRWVSLGFMASSSGVWAIFPLRFPRVALVLAFSCLRLLAHDAAVRSRFSSLLTPFSLTNTMSSPIQASAMTPSASQ
jgi:hypothetical protein